jgi:hypothetical protein
MSLKGKVAIVPGGSSGIGMAITAVSRPAGQHRRRGLERWFRDRAWLHR